MTKGKYAKFSNVPEGSVIEYLEGRAVAWYPRGERVEVKLPLKPVAPLPWEVLTADDARYYADLLDSDGRIGSAWRLRAYACAVDALARKEAGDVED